MKLTRASGKRKKSEPQYLTGRDAAARTASKGTNQSSLQQSVGSLDRRINKAVQKGDLNANVSFEMVSENGKKDVILQRYIPEAEKGDKRVLLLEGKPLGAILRVHGKDDHRNNFFAGGKAVKTSLTDRDLEIIKTIKPKLLS